MVKLILRFITLPGSLFVLSFLYHRLLAHSSKPANNRNIHNIHNNHNSNNDDHNERR
jgi:hypothetical protein